MMAHETDKGRKPFFKGYTPHNYFRTTEAIKLSDLPKAILLGIPYKHEGQIHSFSEVKPNGGIRHD